MATGSIFSNNGFQLAIDRLFGNPTAHSIVSKFGIGTGTATPTISDTALQTPIVAWSGGSDYKAYTAGHPDFSTSLKVIVQGFISPTEANGNSITEYGDFNTDGTPIMASRQVVTGITKTSAIQAFFTTTYKRKV